MSCGAFAECLDPAIYTSLTRPGIKGWGVLMVGKSLLANGWASLAGNAMQSIVLLKILVHIFLDIKKYRFVSNDSGR